LTILHGARSRVCLVLILAVLHPGCSTGRVNLWPLYFHETRQVGAGEDAKPISTTEFLYPLFSRESTPEEHWHAVRPLYNYERDSETGNWRVQFIWPFGVFGSNGKQGSYARFFPLFNHSKTWSNRHQRYTTHDFIFPLMCWGNHAEYGPYLALFPLAGVTHGVIGRTWGFLGFPLYSHYRRAEFVRNDFPWPFLGYGSSPDGKQKMVRFWPFYVYQAYEDDFVKRSTHDLLWPFIRWGRQDKGGEHYFKMLKVAPLFSTVRKYDRSGKKVSDRTPVLGVSLWEQGWSILWGFARQTREPTSDETRIFPFYIRKTRYATSARDPQRCTTRYNVPWPLVWYTAAQMSGDRRQDVFVIAPLYWHYTNTYFDEDGSATKRRRITMFPLATWGHDADGGAHFWIPSHGWTDLAKGYKRNYRAFLELFQYHHVKDPDERETRLLWRLYHHRRSERGRYLSFGPLFTYDSIGDVVGEEGTYVSAFFGLVKRSWSESGGRWRILYIPFGK
jgi:hypothetical protein